MGIELALGVAGALAAVLTGLLGLAVLLVTVTLVCRVVGLRRRDRS